MGTVVTALENLNAMGVIDPRASGVKTPHSITRREVGPVTLTDNKINAAIWCVQTCDIGQCS